MSKDNGRWNRKMNNRDHGLGKTSSRFRNEFDRNTAKLRHDAKNLGNNVKDGLNSAGNFIQGFGKAEGFKGKMKYLGGKVGGKAKNNFAETIKNIKKMFQKIKDTAVWIASHIKIISIITAIVTVLYTGTVFVISMVQSASPTPHFYCDTDASASLKKTSVYQQYCSNGKGFNLENLQGHYIIQDGSGPCTDCATLNMIMRYYSSFEELNFFDYLWQEDGMYLPEGQTVVCSTSATGTTFRHVINGGQTGATTEPDKFHAKVGLKNGAIEFANKHGKSWPSSNQSMANWGYLRDDSLDLAEYEQTSDYYVDNSDNEKWVFDLSLDNRAAGTTWAVVWEHEIRLNGDDVLKCVIKSDSNSPTGANVKEVLDSKNGAFGPAGCLVYYNYGSGSHAVLITGYDEDTGYWRIVDSAKGLSGGFEGPLDGSGNFGIYDQSVANLLDSGQNSCGSFSIERISWVAMPGFN